MRPFAAAGLRAHIDEQGSRTRMIYEPILTVETFLIRVGGE